MTDRAGGQPRELASRRRADERDPRELDVRRSGPAHRGHRTETVRALRPPAWDWSFAEDGALALDPQRLAPDEPRSSSRVGGDGHARVSEAPERLKGGEPFVSVRRMPRQPRGRPTRRRSRDRARAARRGRLLALFVTVAGVAAVVLVLTAFGSSGDSALPAAPAPAKRLLPTGPPQPQIVAVRDELRIQLPVAQGRVTAIAYHAPGDGALALDPVGRRGNEGFVARLAHRLFGGGGSGMTYYQLDGGSGPETGALDVGALAGTAVYAPVDGTVVGIGPYVVNGRRYGSRLEIEPASAPSLVVTLTRLETLPALSVGSPVVAARTKLGFVVDLSRVESQSLARYTQDAGNHVSLVVRPAATLAVP